MRRCPLREGNLNDQPPRTSLCVYDVSQYKLSDTARRSADGAEGHLGKHNLVQKRRPP
jgi:hypothetical protein